MNKIKWAFPDNRAGWIEAERNSRGFYDWCFFGPHAHLFLFNSPHYESDIDRIARADKLYARSKDGKD